MRFFNIATLIFVMCSVCFAEVPPSIRGQIPPDSQELIQRLPAPLRNQVIVVESIDFTSVTVDVKNDTITVEGTTPFPREVFLVPHRHVMQPRLWAYEIVAQRAEKGHVEKNMITPYRKTLKMGSWMGREGVEVIGEVRIGDKTFPKRLKVVLK
jgi:hypothetical protein